MRNPVSRFSYVRSDVDLKRSTFDRNSRHLTTMSAGSLYPLYVDEVLPGDTFSVDMSSLLRMSTPIHPVMDNCYLDTFWFFTPSRIVWTHFKEFMGESPEDPYLNPIEYSLPQLIGPSMLDRDLAGVAPKSVADYMGIPTGSIPESINALPFRAFCAIWNEWFRDQNLQNAIDFSTGDINLGYFRDVNEPDPDEYPYIQYTALGGTLPPVNKYHDYFTSALKEPQKGDPVPIPLSGFAPVYATNLVNLLQKDFGQTVLPTQVVDVNDGLWNLSANLGDQQVTITEDETEDNNIYINNLGADLSNLAGVYATISDLRYAFQLQKFLEADNRGGTRYREILKQHFGVTSPDASQQVPEFLGGKRIPINIAQVLQTSSTDDVSPQGNTAAYSLTTDNYSAFTKSFTEHGYLLCVACVRTEHTYQQGIERLWNKKSKFDFYFPEFANISDQPIYNREIYNYFAGDPIFGESTVGSAYDTAKGVFGFQEPWAEYKYKPNRVSGEFRSTFDQSLDSWHYADNYDSQPYLSDEWIRETRNNVERTLAVQNGHDQFICDFYFKMKTTRCMPLYSIPGLADHH